MDNKIGFFKSFGNFWSKSFDFKSRTPRREFWFATLGNIIIYVISVIAICITGAFAIGLFGLDSENAEQIVVSISFVIYPLVSFISNLSMWTRRAHDSGKKGYLIIPSFIAFTISWIVVYAASVLLMVTGFFSLFSSELYGTLTASFVALVIGSIINLLSLVYLVVVAFSSSGPDNEYGPNPYGMK